MERATSNTDHQKDDGRYYLLFDGECGYCRLFKSAIKLLDIRGNLVPVELGSPFSRILLRNLEPTLVSKSFHLVDATANVMSGGDALPNLISLLFGSKILGRFLHDRHVQGLLRASYILVSRVTSASRCAPNHGSRSALLHRPEQIRKL